MDWPVRRRGPSAAEGGTGPDAEASHDARKTGAESSSISPSFVSVSIAPGLRSSHARTACALPDAVIPSAPSAEVGSMVPKTRAARQRVRKRRINRLVSRWGHSNIHRDTSKLLQGPQQRKKVPGPPFIMAIHQRLMDKTRLAHRKTGRCCRQACPRHVILFPALVAASALPRASLAAKRSIFPRVCLVYAEQAFFRTIPAISHRASERFQNTGNGVPPAGRQQTPRESGTPGSVSSGTRGLTVIGRTPSQGLTNCYVDKRFTFSGSPVQCRADDGLENTPRVTGVTALL